MAALAKSDIDIATRGADDFIKRYYKAYDSKDVNLKGFYRPISSLTWNGTPVQGDIGVKDLIERLPTTKHEVQSFDCHPIPGTTPPSLLVTVSGTVVHGKGPTVDTMTTPNTKTIDGQPRVFAQTFLLNPDPDAPVDDPTKASVVYYVNADAMRFVG